MDVEIRREDQGSRGHYHLVVDGQEAGELDFREHEGRRVFVHTGVREAYEGMGLGSQLARRALDDARAEGLQIIPQCPYVRAYLERHPQDQDLIDQDLWATWPIR